jgi:PAS domain S-box-containing protein
MTDRTELLEAAMDSMPEGVALLGGEGQILLWNRSAEAITGYGSADLLSRQAPEPLEPLLLAGARLVNIEPDAGGQLGHRTLVYASHKQGHDVPVMARYFMLRDGMGGRMGMAILFHPADNLDALPHGESSQGGDVKASQAVVEDRLATMFGDFTRGGLPLGVLWISVDQAAELRKTHGTGACEAMLEKIKQTLANGLRPAEEMGRWGDDEFLILSHERTPEMLETHAQALGGLADLLERAKTSMITSFQAGGNHTTSAPRRNTCSPS